MYVQGGVGAIGDGERFGDNYELPNATAYNETCAAIAQVFWNERMFLLHGDSKYIDVLEKTLYNGLISGIGLDGKSFFYTNAMQIKNSFSGEILKQHVQDGFPVPAARPILFGLFHPFPVMYMRNKMIKCMPIFL